MHCDHPRIAAAAIDETEDQGDERDYHHIDCDDQLPIHAHPSSGQSASLHRPNRAETKALAASNSARRFLRLRAASSSAPQSEI